MVKESLKVDSTEKDNIQVYQKMTVLVGPALLVLHLAEVQFSSDRRAAS